MAVADVRGFAVEIAASGTSFHCQEMRSMTLQCINPADLRIPEMYTQV
jgi:hypothetical protein